MAESLNHPEYTPTIEVIAEYDGVIIELETEEPSIAPEIAPTPAAFELAQPQPDPLFSASPTLPSYLDAPPIDLAQFHKDAT